MKRRAIWVIGAAMSILGGSVLVTGAWATTPPAQDPIGAGTFQLDGNATTEATTPVSDDWANVYCQDTQHPCASPTAALGGAFASAFDHSPALNATNFAGSSKDIGDINSWSWSSTGGLPGKDTLLDGFAARYTAPASATPTSGSQSCPSNTASCSLLYFGSDRWDNSGDAQQGIWFFQYPVFAASNGTFEIACPVPGVAACAGKPAGTDVPAVHKTGDLLIVSDFSIGGTTSTIDAYEWVGSGGDTNGTLNFISGGTNENCGTVPLPSPLCGIVNSGSTSISSPWPFLDKKKSTSMRQGELYEGGVNLASSVFPAGFANECFSSFDAETRSSTSTTATLEDFVMGSFGQCNTTTVTTPEDNNGNGINSTTHTVSIGTGSVQVKDHAVVTPSGPSTQTPTGPVKFYLCGPAASDAAASCASNGTNITPDGSLSPGAGDTAVADSALATVTQVGHYCWRADYQGDSNYPPSSDSRASECFAVTPAQPTLGTQATTGPVTFGSAISDSATLSDTASQPGSPVIDPTSAGVAAAGSISWTAYGPDSCSTKAYGPVSIKVSGDGTYGGSGSTVSFTPGAPGTYTWVASYTPDTSGNTSSVPASACPDTTGTEATEVSQIPTAISTNPWVYPNDMASITTTSGSLSGTVLFSLYDSSSDCGAGTSSGRLYTETVALAGGSSPQTASTSNSTFKVNSANAGTMYWLVQYTSGDTAHTGRQSSCTENVTTSFTNDTAGGTAFSP